jgi:hypothetical protein
MLHVPPQMHTGLRILAIQNPQMGKAGAISNQTSFGRLRTISSNPTVK